MYRPDPENSYHFKAVKAEDTHLEAVKYTVDAACLYISMVTYFLVFALVTTIIDRFTSRYKKYFVTMFHFEKFLN